MQWKWEETLDKESKLRIKITQTPEGNKFSIVYLLFFNDWIDIARIDNYPHEGRFGTHIHRFGEERVEFREMSFEEAVETLIKIGNNIKEKIKNGMDRNRQGYETGN